MPLSNPQLAAIRERIWWDPPGDNDLTDFWDGKVQALIAEHEDEILDELVAHFEAHEASRGERSRVGTPPPD